MAIGSAVRYFLKMNCCTQQLSYWILIVFLFMNLWTTGISKAIHSNTTEKATTKYVDKDSNSSIVNPKGSVDHNGARGMNGTNVTARMTANTTKAPEEAELHLPILIASPVAAVSIVIFVCIAYYWHTKQLDEQAKKLAIQMAAGQCPSTCMPCSPCRTQRLVPPGHARADSELLGSRRKSLRTPTPPPSLGSKRGSCWSALTDQEVLTHASPRRHSTFIL